MRVPEVCRSESFLFIKRGWTERNGGPTSGIRRSFPPGRGKLERRRQDLDRLEVEHAQAITDIEALEPHTVRRDVGRGDRGESVTEQAIAYGIDFGTSNSLISIARPGSVEVVDLGSRRVRQNLPSVIYLNADGNRVAGDPAIEQYLVSAGVNSRLLVGIKSDLSDSRLKGTSSWGMSWTLSDLVEVILRALKAGRRRPRRPSD